jgi:hypothetical protein
MINAPISLPQNSVVQDTAPAIQTQIATMESYTMAPETLVHRKQVLKIVMERIMKADTHYGKVPGCGDKPTLLKPGAEAISSTFQLCPRYKIDRTALDGGHREYEIICELYTPAGGFVGQGVGACSTMEGKYRFRRAGHKCPECGNEETIIKGKQQYGGGWICYAKKGGCGAKFNDGDPRIENQEIGRVEHDNPADYYNTVLKMGKKRAFVDAVLTATGASDIFTQDIEDMPETIPGARRQPQNAGYRQDAAPQPNPTAQMDDMPDGFGMQPNGAKDAGDVPLTDNQKRKIFGACKAKGISLDEMCLSLSENNSFDRQILRVTDMTKAEASTLIQWLDEGALDFLSSNNTAAGA